MSGVDGVHEGMPVRGILAHVKHVQEGRARAYSRWDAEFVQWRTGRTDDRAYAAACEDARRDIQQASTSMIKLATWLSTTPDGESWGRLITQLQRCEKRKFELVCHCGYRPAWDTLLTPL